MIRIERLNKYFNRGSKNELHVLNDINLEFPSTGLVCILGESGSGKTTLLNTLGGLDVFQGGSMAIGDTTLKKYKPSVIEPLRSEKFGYIFQSYYLLQDYSVAYNVRLALNLYDLTEEEKDERVSYVLEQLGIARYKKKLVSKLSGGQQQRVSIARALVKSPQIILADEPTGNLDEENTIRTMTILRNISKECLVILVSHERRIAEFFADRIIEIKDGKIICDRDNSSADTYMRSDDGNIYLPELKQTHFGQDDTQIDVYQKEDTEEETIRLKLAWKDGKLYIRNDMQSEVFFASEEAGCQIFDEPRPELDMEEVENFTYQLENLPAKKTANLPLREIWSMALENIRLLGKKQAFVIVIMLATAILLTLTVSDFSTMALVKDEDIVSDDSHYIQVEQKWTGSYDSDMIHAQQVNFFYSVLSQDGIKENLFFDPDYDMTLQSADFFQMRGLNVKLSDYSYVDISRLKEGELLCGRMPKKREEIVVDALVLRRFMKSVTPLADRFHDMKDFLNHRVLVSSYEKEMTIVGVSNRNEPAVFCSQNLLLGMSVASHEIASIAEMQKQYPEEFADKKLARDEIMIAQSRYDEIKNYKKFQNDPTPMSTIRIGSGMDYYSGYLGEDEEGDEYKIVGTFPDEYGLEYIMSDEGCFSLLTGTMISGRKCKIYIEDAEKRHEVLNAIKEAGKAYAETFKVKVSIPYEKQIKDYKDSQRDKVNSKRLFAILVIALSTVMIYFTIKSNATARMEELTVYRLIGIGKRSIMWAYLLEMLLINTYTTLPALLLTTAVLQFIASIPSMGFSLIFPWWLALGLLALIYLTSCLISMLPVHNILSQPPAKLAVKE